MPVSHCQSELADWQLELKGDGYVLEYTYDGKADDDAPAEDTPPSPPLQTEPTP